MPLVGFPFLIAHLSYYWQSALLLILFELIFLENFLSDLLFHTNTSKSSITRGLDIIYRYYFPCADIKSFTDKITPFQMVFEIEKLQFIVPLINSRSMLYVISVFFLLCRFRYSWLSFS
jgi:hypothetical protein